MRASRALPNKTLTTFLAGIVVLAVLIFHLSADTRNPVQSSVSPSPGYTIGGVISFNFLDHFTNRFQLGDFRPSGLTYTGRNTAELTGPNANDPRREITFPESAGVRQTIQKLQLRVDARIALAGQYAARLDQATPVTNATLYVVHDFHGIIIFEGLGNWMFKIASLFGIARTNGRRPCLVNHFPAEKYFEIFTIDRKNKTALFGKETINRNTTELGDAGAGIFNQYLSNVSALKGDQHVLLGGYLQSWLYFDSFRDDIRSLLTFSRRVFNLSVRAVEEQLLKVANTSVYNTESADSVPTLVGIHVRRGDIITDPRLREHGHKPASEEYLLRAVLRFQRIYPDALFVVVSSDMAYCQQLFQEPNFLFMGNNQEAVDMAILSLMDHIILSVGTFGWWGAYLSDAEEVYYYKDWPRNGSVMQNIYNLEEFFPPSWIPFA